MFQKDQGGNKHQNPKLIYAEEKMKIETSESIRVSKRRIMGKGMGDLLKEGRGRCHCGWVVTCD
ncbi:hypothetical protein Ahy_B03g067463 [Arachis hypogaea]|uniref:Uncharacterized protein n=1 Tax=Arachis hypogaea TaxID=3818 RepID=A0A445A6V8_ARAHY|nr:hypothetical protein Ahy_B03g067463 [Arachis hypogaea]